MTAHRPALYLTNTMGRDKQRFVPKNPDAVSMYVCGVTPYDHSHLGHGRCYVNFDVVYRTLLFLGYSVEYVRNITDVDDKIVKKAEQLDEQLGSLSDRAAAVAQKFTNAFNQDMQALQVCVPNQQPTVSGHIAQIISFIEGLIAKGHAYHAGSDVYFSIESLSAYGELSGKNLEDLTAGARVEVSKDKRNPGDFVLWKGGVVGSLWDSPWGKGRPGWHIECSTFAAEYLGATIDIHGGGQDLIFPHHENERAQSQALHEAPFATYWLHNAHVNIAQQKMSKSLGNFFTLRDLFKQHDPMVLRLYLLQHHYRTPIEFAAEHLDNVARAYQRLARVLNAGQGDAVGDNEMAPNLHVDEWLAGEQGDGFGRQLVDALCDDFNTPKLLGLVFGQLDELAKAPEKAAFVRVLLQQVLGLICVPVAEKEQELTPQIQALIEQRAAARAAKDWAEADRLRDELKALGYAPKDGKA